MMDESRLEQVELTEHDLAYEVRSMSNTLLNYPTLPLPSRLYPSDSPKSPLSLSLFESTFDIKSLTTIHPLLPIHFARCTNKPHSSFLSYPFSLTADIYYPVHAWSIAPHAHPWPTRFFFFSILGDRHDHQNNCLNFVYIFAPYFSSVLLLIVEQLCDPHTFDERIY